MVFKTFITFRLPALDVLNLELDGGASPTLRCLAEVEQLDEDLGGETMGDVAKEKGGRYKTFGRPSQK